jgi:soluble lytic murein transglycosylase-like protein
MQIHPALHKEKLASRGIKPKDLHDIALNIDIGAEILKENLEKTRYDVRRSLFKYVGGRSPVYVNNIINNYVRFDA